MKALATTFSPLTQSPFITLFLSIINVLEKLTCFNQILPFQSKLTPPPPTTTITTTMSKQVPEKYRSSIFCDAPMESPRRRQQTSVNPITGEPLYDPKHNNKEVCEDVSDNVSVSSQSSGSDSVVSPNPTPKQKPVATVQQQSSAPTRRQPPGGYSTLHLG